MTYMSQNGTGLVWRIPNWNLIDILKYLDLIMNHLLASIKLYLN